MWLLNAPTYKLYTSLKKTTQCRLAVLHCGRKVWRYVCLFLWFLQQWVCLVSFFFALKFWGTCTKTFTWCSYLAGKVSVIPNCLNLICSNSMSCPFPVLLCLRCPALHPGALLRLSYRQRPPSVSLYIWYLTLNINEPLSAIINLIKKVLTLRHHNYGDILGDVGMKLVVVGILENAVEYAAVGSRVAEGHIEDVDGAVL